mgnify:FL=1|tara:strand:+ start:568 stop:810 length:243 start_codon:yes stop_codon:yes gene_type:complete
MIVSKKDKRYTSYVGYTNNLENRLKKHNEGKGAKSTRGKKWQLIYSKKFKNKKDAMKYEYFLKNNRKLRLNIKQDFLNTI